MSSRSATFTLSLDLEMAWGSWRRGRWPWDVFEAEPDVVGRLDAVAVALGVPITFGVVGALAGANVASLGDFDPSLGVDAAFPELTGGYEPATVPTIGLVLAHPDAWMNTEVVKTLRSSAAAHEVCSHTFFHTLPRSATLLPTDVALTRRVVGDVSSLIFPRDSVAFVEQLPAAGLNAYRGTGESAYMRGEGRPRRVGRVVHLLDQALGRPAPLAHVSPGPVTCLTTSAYLTLRTGVRRRIPPRVLRRRFLTPLHDAVRRGGNYHLWSHPWNLALPGSDGFDLLVEVLTAAADLQDRGDLRVRTMSQLAGEGVKY